MGGYWITDCIVPAGYIKAWAQQPGQKVFTCKNILYCIVWHLLLYTLFPVFLIVGMLTLIY